MRSLMRLASERSLLRTARNGCACRLAMTLPLPESSQLHPRTSELKSQAECVLSTFTGRNKLSNVRIFHSCCCTLFDQSLMARSVGTASQSLSNVSLG